MATRKDSGGQRSHYPGMAVSFWRVDVVACMERACKCFGNKIYTKTVQCFLPAIHERRYSNTGIERMMPFEEYRKLKKRLKNRARLAGIPMALFGTTVSSAINIHFNPQMLDFQNPEVELTPIL